MSGKVVSVNDALGATPELVNSDPYGAGWLCEIEMSNESDLGDLLDAEAYRSLTGA